MGVNDARLVLIYRIWGEWVVCGVNDSLHCKFPRKRLKISTSHISGVSSIVWCSVRTSSGRLHPVDKPECGTARLCQHQKQQSDEAVHRGQPLVWHSSWKTTSSTSWLGDNVRCAIKHRPNVTLLASGSNIPPWSDLSFKDPRVFFPPGKSALCQSTLEQLSYWVSVTSIRN